MYVYIYVYTCAYTYKSLRQLDTTTVALTPRLVSSAHVCEVVYTGMLCFVFLSCVVSRRNSPPSDAPQFHGLAIGFSLAVGRYWARVEVSAVVRRQSSSSEPLAVDVSGGGRVHARLAGGARMRQSGAGGRTGWASRS